MTDIEFLGLNLWTWIALAVVLVMFVIFFLLTRSKKLWTTRMLTTGALCVALGFILSFAFFKIRMPQAGSITPGSMIPVMLFSWLYGPLPGLGASLIHGILQFIEDPFFVNPIQFILDYILAFAGMAVVGFFKKWFPLGVTVACVLRFICHYLSGMFFFAGDAAAMGDAPAWYSLWYNGQYMGPELIACLLIAWVLMATGALKFLRRYVDKQNAMSRPLSPT